MRTDIIARLRREILPLQGYKASMHGHSFSLGPIDEAFPQNSFPLGAIHEFMIPHPDDMAATWGFVTGIIAGLSKKEGVTVWISSCRQLFPPALALFGLDPGRIIFIDLKREQDCFRAAEEALKCEGLTAVVCEMKEFSFTASRRFQLAVEQSGVTGFVLRRSPRYITTTASIARWKITSLHSEPDNDMPGIGYARWNVELLKVRNGKPGNWKIEFAAQQFRYMENILSQGEREQKKTG